MESRSQQIEKNSIQGLLNERARTHGVYRIHAHDSQVLKQFVFDRLNLEDSVDVYTNDVISDALEMIITKLSRILNGNPYEPDHYRDIAGYAQLVVSELIKK